MSSSPESSESPAVAQPKRAHGRYPLIASAIVTDVAAAVRLNARTSEIGHGGCYLDVLNTLPEGTPVSLLISHHDAVFTCSATIIYIHPNMGMGLRFNDPDPQNRATLESWIRDLTS